MTAGPAETGGAAERDVTWLDSAEDPMQAEDMTDAEDLPEAEVPPEAEVLPETDPVAGTLAQEDSPIVTPAGPGATSAGVTSASVNGRDERWHDIVAGFIDDPRSSVAEAAELVEAEVTALIALLSRRRDSLGETWQTSQVSEAGGATEELRLAMRGYREFSSQLAASVKALS